MINKIKSDKNNNYLNNVYDLTSNKIRQHE